LVSALAVTGTDLYAGGVARWNGSAWSALGSGVGGPVYALTMSGADLYAGGAFWAPDGAPGNFIAKWDGSAWSALGSGMNMYVYALATDGAGHLFVGGGFTLAGTNACHYIAQAKLEADLEAQFNFTITNDTVTITGYTGAGGAVTIPSAINGLPVTRIGDRAFYQCTNLNSVTIPDSVTFIGDSVFYDCTSLAAITADAFNPIFSSVDGVLFDKSQTTLIQCPGGKAGSYTIPDSVTSIGHDAFQYCTRVTNVTIGNGVTSIGDDAFIACSSLTNVTIGNGATSIGNLAFYYCTSLTALHFGGNAPSLGGSEVFQGDNHATVYYLPGTTGWGTTFGGLPTALWQRQPPGAWTLSASPITPTGATLNGTVNPNGWPTTAWFQWGNTTNYGNLTSATNQGSGTTALPLSATLAGLTPKVTYHFRVAATNDYGLAYGSDQSFTPLISLTVVTLPATSIAATSATLNGTANPNAWPTTAWFQWGTTANYGNLTSVTDLGSGTNALPLLAPLAGLAPSTTYHFRAVTSNGTGVAYGSDQSFATKSSPTEFNYTITAGTVTITKYIGAGAAVTIPDTINGLPVISIGDLAFDWCTNLTSVTIPNSVTSIGDYAFEGCTNLTSLPRGNSVTNIGDFAFQCCYGLTTATIPTNVTTIGKGPFAWCTNLTAITVEALNSAYSSVEGVLFNKSQATLIQYPGGKAGSYTVPNSVTSIGPELVCDCWSLINVTIPSSVISIGQLAFYNSFSLMGVYFQGNAPTLSVEVFTGDNNVIVYYLPGTTGWGSTYGDCPTAVWVQVGTIQVYTGAADFITRTSAELNGTVNPNGWPTTAWFQWGATTNYGNLTAVTALGSGTTALPLSAPLAGLTPNVIYHFRIAATNDYGLVYGSDQSFTTQAQPGDAGWTLNGGATMTGNTIALTFGAGSTSRSAFLNNKQDVTAFNIVFFYQDVSGAGSADGVTFCIQNQAATALGGAGGGLGYDGIAPSVALAMNIYIWAPNGRGIGFAQNGMRGTPYQSLLPNVDIGGNTNIIQVNVDYNGTVMTMTFKDTVTGGIASTNWTLNIPSVVGGSTAYVGFTGADGGVASIQTISWGDSTPTILIPPRTQTAEAGSAVGLSVHASSALPLSFLWYLNDTNLISWSTNSDLELTNVQISNSGAYTIVVTNVAGAVTSPPAMLQVIAAVERRPVPGIKVTGESASLLHVDYANSLSPAPTWTPLGSVSLTSTTGYCCDPTLPLPPQRFYRAWQSGTPSVMPSLDLNLVPAITLTGSIGHSVRLDYINQFGPTDAWVTLDTVPLTNTSQLYFDISAPGQPPRLYRLVPSP
jgi:hypothetical protein